MTDLRRFRPMILLMALAAATIARPQAAPMAPGPQAGQMAPALAVKPIQAPMGVKLNLDSLRGNVLVVEFWATWCPPCVKAIPHMNGLAEKFKGRPVRFLSLSIEHDREDLVREFVGKTKMSGWVGIADAATWRDRYGVFGVPETFLIGRDGRVLAVAYPTDLTEMVLEDALAGRPLSLPKKRAPIAPAMRTDGEAVAEVVVTPVATRGRASRMGPDGKWTHAGADIPTLLEMIYGASRARMEIPPSLPGHFALKTAFPATLSMDEMRVRAQKAVPPALGVEVRRERKTVDTLVLRAPTGPGAGLKRAKEMGHGGRGPGFSSGVGCDIGQMMVAIELDTGLPVIDETKLEGLFDWNLNYTSRHVADLKAELQRLGITVTREQREIEVLVVGPIPSKRRVAVG